VAFVYICLWIFPQKV